MALQTPESHPHLFAHLNCRNCDWYIPSVGVFKFGRCFTKSGKITYPDSVCSAHSVRLTDMRWLMRNENFVYDKKNKYWVYKMGKYAHFRIYPLERVSGTGKYQKIGPCMVLTPFGDALPNKNGELLHNGKLQVARTLCNWIKQNGEMIKSHQERPYFVKSD